MFTKVVLLIILVVVGGNTARCPTEYTKFNGKCYKISSEYLTKSGAAARCRQNSNGTLASIPNAFVNSFLSVLANNVSTSQIYIGINCPQINEIGDFSSCKWDDGTPFGYEHYKLNTLFPGSSCAYMDTLNKSNGFWQSCKCDMLLNFVCETNVVSGTYVA